MSVALLQLIRAFTRVSGALSALFPGSFYSYKEGFTDTKRYQLLSVGIFASPAVSGLTKKDNNLHAMTFNNMHAITLQEQSINHSYLLVNEVYRLACAFLNRTLFFPHYACMHVYQQRLLL